MIMLIMKNIYIWTIIAFIHISYLHDCRLWCIVSINDHIIPDLNLEFITNQSEYFQNLGPGYDDGWSLTYYNSTNQFGDIYRSAITADIDSNYQSFLMRL